MYKEVDIVMLPTNKSKLSLYDGILVEKRNSPFDYKEVSVIKPQNLYIISDEEINELDYFLSNQYGGWELQRCQKVCSDGMLMSYQEEIAMFQEDTYFTFKPENCKKIVATTNKTLKIDLLSIDKSDYPKLYPQPSKQFIDLYCKKYNEGNKITKVMLEYVFADHDLALFRDERTLKVNPDNTINIKNDQR